MQICFVDTGCYWHTPAADEKKTFVQYDGRTTFHGTLSEAPSNSEDWRWQYMLDEMIATYDEFVDADSESDDDNM